MTDLIPLNRLHAHPGNANVMPKRLLRTLAEHIRESRRYPPIIVRPHATIVNDYEILDGHHRVQALKSLSETHARCDVWKDVDDDRAAILLLTLNRLQGADDPKKRGALIASLCGVKGDGAIDALVRRLPDDRRRIERLLALARTQPPAPKPAAARQAPHFQPITFFLTRDQARSLDRLLRSINPRDRSAALMTVIETATSK